MKTLIIGLGNPILGDDGVGWVVAKKVEEILAGTLPEVKIECYALSGISLMEQMVGFERVILIDSLNTGNYSQGKVNVFTLDSLTDLTHGHSASAHDLSLTKAMEMGRTLAANLPADQNISIVAIEATHVYEFGEVLTPEIEAAVPLAAGEVFKLLGVKYPG